MGFTNFDVESLSQANAIIVLTLDTISGEIRWRHSQNGNFHYLIGSRTDDSVEVISVLLDDMVITECVVNDDEIKDFSLVEHLLCTIMFSDDFNRMNYNKFLDLLYEHDLDVNSINGLILPFDTEDEEEDEEYDDDDEEYDDEEDEEDEDEDDEDDADYDDEDDEHVVFGPDESEDNDFWGQDEYYESEEDDDEDTDIINNQNDNYFDRLNPESILTEYGYSVAKNIGLSPNERRNILKKILKNENISKAKIISHLEWCIAKHPQKNQKEARAKWHSDIDFLRSLRY